MKEAYTHRSSRERVRRRENIIVWYKRSKKRTFGRSFCGSAQLSWDGDAPVSFVRPYRILLFLQLCIRLLVFLRADLKVSLMPSRLGKMNYYWPHPHLLHHDMMMKQGRGEVERACCLICYDLLGHSNLSFHLLIWSKVIPDILEHRSNSRLTVL